MTALAAVWLALLVGGQSPDAEILGVSVVRASHDEVELSVRYRLETSEPTSLGAITLFRERSTGHWSYQPAKLRTGTHEAIVTVGVNADAPPVYRSDQFKISMSGGARLEYLYPYEKLWCARADACDDSMLDPARYAPIEERLTSVQPSIRVAALDEAAAWDEALKRELLPGIAERILHAELGVRFNALRLLQEWQLSDSVLTAPLADAMLDPHPGIARVATSTLADLAPVDDALAEDALTRATESTDASTRDYARNGLARLKRLRALARKPTLDTPAPEDEAACTEAGGRWGLFGLYRIEECNVPAPDAGAACQDSDECISVCVSEQPVANAGACYGWTIVRGTCLSYFEDGTPGPTLCVD